jgi:hydroxyethylthiazole kinase-like uncharacterized protein yjeF
MTRPLESFAVTRQQARRIDAVATEHYGVPGLILMENAGRESARVAVEMLGEPVGKRVVVLCGNGNNGGDGFVIARHLTNAGADVRVALLADAEKLLAREDDAATNLAILLKSAVPVHEVMLRKEVAAAIQGADLIVDALLGTGLQTKVRPPLPSTIEVVNSVETPVLAVDVPSGLDCDTGEPLGLAVSAKRTVTFVFIKTGFLQPNAAPYTGAVTVVPIGVPRIALEHLVKAWEQQG